MCCVVVCDLETSRIGAPYMYDISSLRVKLIVIFPPMTSIKKTEKKTKPKQLMLHSLLMSSEPLPGPSSTK